jgi:fimbrial chaperone protein
MINGALIANLASNVFVNRYESMFRTTRNGPIAARPGVPESAASRSHRSAIASRVRATVVASPVTLTVAGLILFLASGTAAAQGITVMPVNITLSPGQNAAALTVRNNSGAETSLQVRGFVWSQKDGIDQTTATDDVLLSPPLGTVAVGASQIVRLVLRKPAQGQEATYRIFLDEIPPPAAPGQIRIALRLSIPIFAQPATRIAAHVQWRIEADDGKTFLAAVNDGSRHETAREMKLATADGTAVKIQGNLSPYILCGSTRRWPIVIPGPALTPGSTLHLTAKGDAGEIDQQVSLSPTP